jgi:hypothetical protein
MQSGQLVITDIEELRRRLTSLALGLWGSGRTALHRNCIARILLLKRLSAQERRKF